MIVSLKLSVPDSEIGIVNYHIEQIQALATKGAPGYVRYKFTGAQGLYKAPRKSRNVETPRNADSRPGSSLWGGVLN